MRSRVQITRHLHPTAPAIYQSRLHKLRPHLLTTPPFRTILSRPGLTARFEAPDDPAAGVTSITATTITSFRVAAGERKPESLVVVTAPYAALQVLTMPQNIPDALPGLLSGAWRSQQHIEPPGTDKNPTNSKFIRHI